MGHGNKRAAGNNRLADCRHERADDQELADGKKIIASMVDRFGQTFCEQRCLLFAMMLVVVIVVVMMILVIVTVAVIVIVPVGMLVIVVMVVIMIMPAAAGMAGRFHFRIEQG